MVENAGPGIPDDEERRVREEDAALADEEAGKKKAEAKAAKKNETQAKKVGALVTTVRKGAKLTTQDWPLQRLEACLRMVRKGNETMNTTELIGFMTVAEKYQLDPFIGQIFAIPTENGFRPAVYRDGLLAVADRHPESLGFISGVWYENDAIEIDVETTPPDIVVGANEPGLVRIAVAHKINPTTDRGNIGGAYCVVYRREHPPTLIVRRFSDYKHLHNRKNWLQNPEDMIESRAIAAAHRRAYSLSNLYLAAELQEMDTTPTDPTPTEKTADRLKDLREKIEKRNGEEKEPEEIPEAEFEVLDDEPVAAEEAS